MSKTIEQALYLITFAASCAVALLSAVLFIKSTVEG